MAIGSLLSIPSWSFESSWNIWSKKLRRERSGKTVSGLHKLLNLNRWPWGNQPKCTLLYAGFMHSSATCRDGKLYHTLSLQRARQSKHYKRRRRRGRSNSRDIALNEKYLRMQRERKKEKKIWRIHWTFGLRCLCLFLSYRVSSMMS